MTEGILVVTDHGSAMTRWGHPVCSFEEMTPERLAAHAVVVLGPGAAPTQEACETVLGWKRAGLLDGTKLFLGNYSGRHVWSPENDALVERWVVHARSERLVLDSDRLAFVPLCLSLPEPAAPGDDGYLFTGGRKWREIEVALAAMQRSGLPGRVVTDIAPGEEYPGIEIIREKIPRDDYLKVMGRARVVLVPLKQIPISHGHSDVVFAVLAGRPAVVTAGSSCDDYVRHGVSGLLVRDNSVEAWTDAVLEANERAEEFAAGARELAPQFHSSRYNGYLDEMIADPDRYRIQLDAALVEGHAPRSEWEHLRQENYIRRIKVQHREMVTEAKALLREKRYAEAVTILDGCLEGPYAEMAQGLRATALAKSSRGVAAAS